MATGRVLGEGDAACYLHLSQEWFCGLLANNNDYDDVYGAIIMTSDCEISPGSFDECRLSAGWPPTLRLSQMTVAVSLPKIGSYHLHPPSPLLLLLVP